MGIVVVAWGLLVLASALWERGGGRPLETCLLLRFTGHPCPTCGSTRALFAMFQGHPAQAFHLNPLFSLLLPGVAFLALMRLGFGRCLRLDGNSREYRFLLFAGLATLAANWAWVLEFR